MSIDAMKQALDYIKATNKSSSFWLVPASELNKTVTALRLAIEQAEKQEPVAWMDEYGDVLSASIVDGKGLRNIRLTNIPLYTAPPQRQPLSAKAIAATVLDHCYGAGSVTDDMIEGAASAIERAHGIGGEHE